MKNPIPETMTINGQDCSDKGTIAESFNTFFASIGKQNELNIRTHHWPHFEDYLTGANNFNFSFHLIENTTTFRIIKYTKSATSKGHDGISSEFLKLISADVSKCVTTIINRSLTSGIFPNSLKIAKVTPIFKKENNKLITNYRPISVLPVLSKLFETVISEQLIDYFLTNNLLYQQQYGVKKILLLSWRHWNYWIEF